MRKTSKLIVALLIVLTIATISVSSFATGTAGDLLQNLNTDQTVTIGGMQGLANNIIGVIRAVGIIIAVVILLILGIKYMMGSAEEKADYKKSMIPYIVGAVLIFAGSTLVNIIYNFVTGLNTK